MSKKLKIETNSAIVKKNDYSIEINGEEIKEWVLKKLPKDMEDFTAYAANVAFNIEIFMDKEEKVIKNYDNVEEEECQE